MPFLNYFFGGPSIIVSIFFGFCTFWSKMSKNTDKVTKCKKNMNINLLSKPISHKQKSLGLDLCLIAKTNSGLFHLLFYVLVNMSCISCHVLALTWM